MVCCDYISTCRWDCAPKYAYGGFLKWGSPKLDGLQWEIQKNDDLGLPETEVLFSRRPWRFSCPPI